MVRTESRRKERLPSHLVYALKLSDLSCALADDSVDLLLSVRFWSYKAAKQGEHLDRYPILEVRFNPGTPDTRDVWVYAIPKDVLAPYRDMVASILNSDVIPWILSKRTDGWLQRAHSLEVAIRSGKQSLEVKKEDRA